MSWRFGTIDRTRVPKSLRRYAPVRIEQAIERIDLNELWESGKRLILLDVDNTLVRWHAEEYAPSVVAWVESAHAKGFDLCILSNTRRPARLARIATFFQVDSMNGRFKPHPSMYLEALRRYDRTSDQAVMIGDQLMTDVLGANRAHIDAIWLKPLHTKEFFGTKFNRGLERVIRPFLFKMVLMPESDAIPAENNMRRQIIRFVVVGGTSFVIDYLLTNILMKVVPAGNGLVSDQVGNWVLSSSAFARDQFHTANKAAAPILGGVASFIAMFNSFYWNRKWTFGAEGATRTLTQLHRFYTISILGACWNALIFGAVYNMFAADQRGAVLVAKMVAAGVVAIWNFLGQRHYAFRDATLAK